MPLDSPPPSSKKSTPHQKILQLHRHLELYSEGRPPRNSLFVLGRAPMSGVISTSGGSDHLLLIDPPADSTQRFRLEGNVAALSTTGEPAPDLPTLHTGQEGVAHIRIGNHLLDIYTQSHGAVVHIPALGVACSGDYASDETLSKIGPKSDGQEELDTLRLLARLVKQHRLQLLIPHIGTICRDKYEVMSRLAADVAYIHGLRRVIPAMRERAEPIDEVFAISHSLLPPDRHSALCAARNQQNIREIYIAEGNSQR